jgi:hypothetical protein
LGTECWLLVNEGEDIISGNLNIKANKNLACYDLWNREYARLEAGQEITLPVRGSLLIFVCKVDEANCGKERKSKHKCG